MAGTGRVFNSPCFGVGGVLLVIFLFDTKKRTWGDHGKEVCVSSLKFWCRWYTPRCLFVDIEREGVSRIHVDGCT